MRVTSSWVVVGLGEDVRAVEVETVKVQATLLPESVMLSPWVEIAVLLMLLESLTSK